MAIERQPPHQVELAVSRETVACVTALGAGCAAAVGIGGLALMNAFLTLSLSDWVHLSVDAGALLAAIVFGATSWIGLAAMSAAAFLQKVRGTATESPKGNSTLEAIRRGGRIATVIQMSGFVFACLVSMLTPVSPSQFGSPALFLGGLIFLAVTGIALVVVSTIAFANFFHRQLPAEQDAP